MPRTKISRGPRKGGDPWTDAEKRLVFALSQAGAKGKILVRCLNGYYDRRGKSARSVGSVNNARAEFKGTVVPTDTDLALARKLLAELPSKGPGVARMTLQDTATVPPVQLSAGARKALEAKIVIHRFRLETPESSIEVAVSGKNAENVFKNILGAITLTSK